MNDSRRGGLGIVRDCLKRGKSPRR